MEGTLCLERLSIDLVWFESFYLFSLSVILEVAESLMVELLFALEVEIPMVEDCWDTLDVWRTLLFFNPKFWPLLLTVELTSPPDVLLASWAFWCKWAYLFITKEEFCCWFGYSNLLSIWIFLMPVPEFGWWITEYLPLIPLFELVPVCLSLLKTFCCVETSPCDIFLVYYYPFLRGCDILLVLAFLLRYLWDT